MKFKILMTAFFLSCITLVSCQKGDDGGSNPDPLLNDSTYLDKVFYTYHEPGFTDTAKILEYQYDGAKRVSKFIALYVNDAKNTSVYFYNGTETSPAREVIYVEEYFPASKDTVTKFYTYDAQGRRVKDSVISSFAGWYSIHEYKYASGKIYGMSRYFPGSQISTDSATVDAAGNVLSNKSYNDNVLSITSQFTYDNNPSPFAKPSNHITFDIFPFGETLVGEFHTMNNRLKAHEVSGTTYDQDLTGKYVFLPSGYPSSVKDADPAFPGEYDEILFRYKTL
jgi:hypothetical protein